MTTVFDGLPMTCCIMMYSIVSDNGLDVFGVMP